MNNRCRHVFDITTTGTFEATFNSKDNSELKILFRDYENIKKHRRIYYAFDEMVAEYMYNESTFHFCPKRMFQGEIDADGKINLWFKSRNLSEVISAHFTSFMREFNQGKIEIHTTEFTICGMKFDFDVQNETIKLKIEPFIFPKDVKKITVVGAFVW